MAASIKALLFPTDFSDLSIHALPYARTLVDTFEAQLHCLHVVDDASLYWTTFGPEAVPLGPPVEEFLTQARSRMERFTAEHLTGLTKPPITEVRAGRPFVEIIGYAKDNAIDLIVLATHGRGAIAHVILGSTAEKVVRKAPCPVLTVRPDSHRFVMP
jgi:nucleotide-binding universal stress UspA family protein